MLFRFLFAYEKLRVRPARKGCQLYKLRKMQILVGTAGFSYKDWEGIVYPPELKRNKQHPLEYLARFFDCCEINTSFYGHIEPQAGKKWCAMVAEVNPTFEFTAKLNKAFT